MEDEVEHEGEKGWLKQVYKSGNLPKKCFLSVLKRENANMQMVCCRSWVMSMQLKDVIMLGRIMENYGIALEFIKEKNCDVTVPMRSEKHVKSLRHSEENIIKQ